MTIKDPSPSHLQQIIQGFQVTQAIYVIAKLGIADLLKDGPRQNEDLAQATRTHAPSLYRVLRLMTAIGIVAEADDHYFTLLPLGSYLQTGVPGSLRNTVLAYGEKTMWQIWGNLLHSVETGEPSYEHVFGMKNWEYRAQHPEVGALFDNFMTEWTARVAPTVATAYDFSSIGTLVDVGGGHGQMLTSILQVHSTLQGVLFDLPHVVKGAASLLSAAGVSDRCTLIGGDAFTGLPAGYDAYLLSRVLHDWDDEHAVALLASCHWAMASGGKLLLVERVIIPENVEEVLILESDLQMLVATGGKERTETEYRLLLGAAGFEMGRIIPVAIPYNLIEARSI